MKKLTRLRITEIALCAGGRNPEAEILLYKSQREKMDLTTLPEDVRKHIEKLQADLDAAATANVELQKSLDAAKAVPVDPPAVTVEVTKALDIPIEIQKHLDTQTREIENLRKALDVQASEKFVAVAKSELAHVPGIDGLAAKLYTLSKSDSALVEELRTVMKALGARAEVGTKVLTSELGAATSGDSDVGVMDKVTNLAKSLVTAGKAPSLAHAISAVFRDNPELYTQYDSENK